ncbi:hypothetical protein B9Z55_004108 [Caenorhabditis nigoni]|uniref:Uncharacterized protein n=1 Tax=Caenorhabditis nigoni TaxID=1611254 RepID=A0A2G5UVR8_9PELO|nr:hypothetical protein B9Z55_004108 [Caenorhabditis nigoni]
MYSNMSSYFLVSLLDSTILLDPNRHRNLQKSTLISIIPSSRCHVILASSSSTSASSQNPTSSSVLKIDFFIDFSILKT